MRVYFIANIRLSASKVHGIQVAQMCAAFAKIGCDVTLLAPKDKAFSEEVFFESFALDQKFVIKLLPSFGSPEWGEWGFRLRTVSFSLSALAYAILHPADVFFSREEIPLRILGVLPVKQIWEMHNEKMNKWVRNTLRNAHKVIAISSELKELSIKNGAKPKDVVVLPNGVNQNRFRGIEEMTKEQCRRELELPVDKKLVAYTGHLTQWKGIETLAETSHYIDEGTNILFVGRCDRDFKETILTKGNPERMLFVEEEPYTRTALYQRSADILALPLSGKNERARLYTSPVKLFEYMLAERPVVASSIPSIRDIIDEGDAFLVKPDDAEAFASGIKEILSNPEEADRRAKRARELVKKHTWERRAQKIIESIS